MTLRLSPVRRRRVAAALLGALAAVPVGAAAAAAQSQSQSQSQLLSVPDMRADFTILRRALAEAHGGYARHAPRAAVTAQLAAMGATITRPTSQSAFAAYVAQAVATLRDGHLRLEYDPATVEALSTARVMPLRVALEGSRVVLSSIDALTDTVLSPGMELVRINGRPTAEVVRTLLPTVSGDGFIETGRRQRLAREWATLYWLFLERPALFVVEARTTDGRVVRTTLPGVLERDRRAQMNAASRAYAQRAASRDSTTGLIGLEWLEGGRVARLRIRGFDGATFRALLDSAFATIRSAGVTGVVLDLRGNGGGVDEYGALLVGHLLAEPFRYFDRIHLPTIAPRFATWPERTFTALRGGTVADPAGGFLVTPAYHTGVGEQVPAAEPYRGALVTLIDGGTFSTAADVAAQLRSHARTRFVGEETGGGYEGNTSALNALIVLPNSGLRLKIMMYDYWNAVAPPAAHGRGTLPDDVVMTRVSDVAVGRDPALEQALTLLKR